MPEPVASFRVGRALTVALIPPVEANTERFDAGPLVFGVERRVLDDGVFDEIFDPDERATSTVAELRPGAGIDDRGVAVHVFDTVTMFERLRFDCFEDNPHYHYIGPGDESVVVAFDEVAHGPMIAWVVDCIRSGRVSEMVAHTGTPGFPCPLRQDGVDAVLGRLTEGGGGAV